MGNSRLSGPLIVGGEIFAAGTTVYKTKPGAASTIRSTAGRVTAQTGFVTAGGISAAGTLRAVGGLGFVAGDYKKFAVGTYFGLGGATAPITSTGLTTIGKIFMSHWTKGYASATTLARNTPRPVIANGTVGSFYPLVYRTAATNKNVQLGIGNSATFNWLAIGA